MTDSRDFVVGHLHGVPEAGPLVAEHCRDHDGGVLLHLLVADVRRLSEEAWRRHDGDVVRRCVHRLERALRTSEDAVQNAVAVSFVEDTGWWDTAMDACLPGDLAARAGRRGGTSAASGPRSVGA